MKAVNLVPPEARRGRGASGARSRPTLGVGGFGPAQFIVVLMVIVVVLVLLRVISGNDVNNKKATLAAVQGQVATEQALAAKLNVYVTLIQAIQAREAAVVQIAEQRFAWKRTLDQISHVMPDSTSLTSLGASTADPAAAVTAGTPATGPTFSLSGCANTKNQDGVATLLRRLRALTGVQSVGFQSSTRATGCGNSFSLQLVFNAPGSTATSSGTSTAVAPATTATTTTPSTTTTGAAG